MQMVYKAAGVFCAVLPMVIMAHFHEIVKQIS